MDVRLPDGTVIRNIPDGMSQAELTEKLTRNGYDASKLAMPSAAPKAPTDNNTLAGVVSGKYGQPQPLSRTDKVLKGMWDPIDGGAQLLEKGLQKVAPGFLAAGNRANNWLNDKVGFPERVPEGGVDQMTREAEAKYQARRKAQGESGFDGWRMGGNVASPANLAIAARAPAAVSLAGRIAVGAGTGAASGAISPVGAGDYWDEKKKQIASGMVVGGALPAVTAGISRMISPNASKNEALKLLQDEGVRPTIGQALGGMANKFEEKLQSMPLMGDMISRARRSANSDFEAAAFNRALKPIGQELPAGLSGRDAVAHTETALRTSYDDVLNKIGAIKPDEAFNSKLSSLQGMVDRLMMPKAQKAKFAAAVDDFKQSLDSRGVMTSDAYKALESSLGTDARKLASSTDIYEGKIAPAVRQLQEELRDMLKRQAGQHADELTATNAGWANFKRVQNAAGKIGADDGKFTATQFQNAVRTLDKSKDKSAFARGSALGQDLGDAGKTILGNKVPDSGTAGRMFLNGGVAASYFAHPAIPTALAAGGAAYLSPVQRALVASVTKRPELADEIAQMLGKTSPYLSGAAAPVGLGLLGD